jgi:iron complex outermembrane recepter protein
MSMLHAGRKALFLALVLVFGTGTEIDVFAQNAQGENGLEEIVVTGSRIARRDYTSQSPIVTVDKEAFNSRTSIGLEATLDQLPQFNMTGAGSAASNSAASTPFPQANVAPGAATVNLRGLGLNRSLVLLDGRRVQPVNGLLVVDLNTIPSAAIERVEVITGGAAAVYGADAIGGVVNFILKKNFEGVSVNMQSAVSQEGDGNESSVNGLLGASFADGRGSVMLGADYTKRDVILGKDRDWVVRGWNDPNTTPGGLGSSNLSQMTVSGGNAPNAALFPLSPTGTYTIDQNGAVFDSNTPLDPAHPYTGPLGGGSGFKINQSTGALGFNDQAHSYLQLPLERYSLFGSGRIALTDKIDVFSDIHFSETYATSQGFTSSVFNVWSPTIPYNPLADDPASASFGQPQPGYTALHPVPAQFAALLNSRPTPGAPWTYVGGLDYFGNFETDTTTNVFQVIGGLKGDFTVGKNDWNWEAYASHGKTSVNAQQPEGFPFLPRMQNLFNANQYGEDFDISSLPGYFPLAVTGHCTTGLPIFNHDGSVDDTPSVSQDCSDYAVLRMNDSTQLEQNVVEATVTGTVLNMKSGPVRFAAGVDYRKEDFTFSPDSGYNANQDFPNVIQNIVLPVAVQGRTDAKEVFGELAIPLWKDRVELDPGVRLSDYNTVGKVTTYKILGSIKIVDWVRLRGGYQYANRAPNVTELFTPRGGTSLALPVTDACENWIVNVAGTPTSITQSWGNAPGNPNRFNVQVLCQYLMTREGAPASMFVPGGNADDFAFSVFGGGYFPISIAIQQGNPLLDSETADTYTAGVVMNLPFAERLTLSIDAYRITIDQAIGIPGHDAVYQQCLDAASNGLIGDAPGAHSGAELAAGSPACALIKREYIGGAPLTPGNYGADRNYLAQYINQGGIKSKGIDLQLDWGIGNFNVNVQNSWLDTYAESPFKGSDFIDYTGTVRNSSFDYRFFSTVRWGKGPISVGMRMQYLPSLKPAPGSAANLLDVHSHEQIDVFGSWMFKQRWQLRGGIDNLLNEDPEWVGATTANNAIGASSSNYDTIGRRMFLGLQVNL